MQKNWYVFLKDHHQGPYSKQDLKRLYYQGQLKRKTFIWKRGFEDWIVMGDVSEFSDLFSEPETVQSQLPPIPQFDEASGEYRLERAVEQEPVENKVEIALKKRQKKKVRRKKISTKVESTLFEDEIKAPQRSRLRLMGRLILLLTLVIGVGAGLVFYRFIESGSPVRPLGLSDSDFEASQQVISQDASLGLKSKFIYSEKSKKIWLASNLAGEGKVDLSLRSVDYRVLAARPVELSRKAYYENHFVTFNAIASEDFKPIAPGLYELKIYAPAIQTFWQRWLRRFFNLKQKPLVLTKRMILGGYSEEELKVKVNQYNKRLSHLKLKDKSDLLQKYNSLVALLGSLESLYFKYLGPAKTSKRFKRFEKHYTEQISTLLSEISYENKRLANDFEKSRPALAEAYLEQLDFGKKIATLAMTTMKKVYRRKNLSQSFKDQLSQEFRQSNQNLKESLFLKIYALQDEIDEYSKQFLWN